MNKHEPITTDPTDPTDTMSPSVDSLLGQLEGAETETILGIARECGWKEEDYHDLCEYRRADDAWYPRDGSDYSIVDHALDYLRKNHEEVKAAIKANDELDRLS